MPDKRLAFPRKTGDPRGTAIHRPSGPHRGDAFGRTCPGRSPFVACGRRNGEIPLWRGVFGRLDRQGRRPDGRSLRGPQVAGRRQSRLSHGGLSRGSQHRGAGLRGRGASPLRPEHRARDFAYPLRHRSVAGRCPSAPRPRSASASCLPAIAAAGASVPANGAARSFPGRQSWRLLGVKSHRASRDRRSCGSRPRAWSSSRCCRAEAGSISSPSASPRPSRCESGRCWIFFPRRRRRAQPRKSKEP